MPGGRLGDMLKELQNTWGHKEERQVDLIRHPVLPWQQGHLDPPHYVITSLLTPCSSRPNVSTTKLYTLPKSELFTRLGNAQKQDTHKLILAHTSFQLAYYDCMHKLHLYNRLLRNKNQAGGRVGMCVSLKLTRLSYEA